MSKVAIVCGLTEESNILNGPQNAVVVSSGGNIATLTARLEAAISAGCDRVLSFGTCGALNPQLEAGQMVTARGFGAGDDKWWLSLASAASAKLVVVTSSTATLTTPAEKAALFARSKADVVDLETIPALRIALAHGLPAAMLRAVSDTSTQDIPPAAIASISKTGGLNLAGMFASLAEDDEQWGAFERLAESSSLAFNALALALADIGMDFSSGT